MRDTKDEVDYPTLLHQTYQEAVERNIGEQKHWNKLKEEYSSLESVLKELPNELTKSVMVPVAPRALMRGKITHTNEVLVCLGQGYFVKRSAVQATEICKRRRKICEDMLASLEKEKELFIRRQELPLTQDAFGGSEIIEEYNEEEEARWRAEHRKKEKEYRQKLAELREKEKTAVVDEESLWKKLDELELQEELEEELDRLHAEESEEEEDYYESEEEASEPQIMEKEYKDLQDIGEESIEEKEKVKSVQRVSFANSEKFNSSEEEIRITFQHSSIPSSSINSELSDVSAISNPSELYTHFRNKFLLKPKSILKKINSHNTGVAEATNPEEIVENDAPIFLTPPVLDEVMERDLSTSSQMPTKERPVSRFKALRQKKR